MGDNLAKVIDLYVESDRYKRLGDGSRDYYYRSLMLVRKSIGDMPVDDVKPYVIQAILDELTDHPGKQQNVCASIKAMESWALLRNLLPHAITVKHMELVGSDGGFDPWTPEQIRLAIEHSPPHLARVIKLEINTGQRSSDIIRMRWSDVDRVRGSLGIRLTTQKVGRQLFIPFWDDDFVAEIQTWGKQSPLIILNADGLPYPTRNKLSQDWADERNGNPALIRLRNPAKVLHGLRSTTVVGLRKKGLSEGQIADLVGMSVKMVARYCRHADKEDANVNTVEQIRNVDIVFPAKFQRNQ